MTAPFPIEVPVGGSVAPVNAYILVGSPTTIVDPGPDTEHAYAALRDGLATAGLSISSLEQIVITHGHVDHAGVAGRLNAESGARVLVHPSAVSDLADFESAWKRRTEVVLRAASAADAPPEVRDAFLDIARIRRRLFGIDVPADSIVPLADGTRIRAGAKVWSAVHTPGHSRDHIALTDMGTEVIVGDLLIRGAPTMPALETRHAAGASPGTLEALFGSWHSLGRLRAERAWPGHGPPIRAPRVLLARRIAALRTALRETRLELQSSDLSPWEVAMKTGLSPSPERLLGTLAHIFSRLEWLHERGLVSREQVEGITRYRYSLRRSRSA